MLTAASTHRTERWGGRKGAGYIGDMPHTNHDPYEVKQGCGALKKSVIKFRSHTHIWPKHSGDESYASDGQDTVLIPTASWITRYKPTHTRISHRTNFSITHYIRGFII
ncbi:hypothetical protein AG1IA_01534 [Rhizoctonia solani AG-1 IA]|uniref:Uncharacterized protein n=1 Tax=Thanatephorus cucumeris (strain AG1-IA) TaxID=983506 RepID=L8X2J9_THACA|nr:hypothetical protein AG1IA_01534 [Rhizoctonia solani AG-1 IA]